MTSRTISTLALVLAGTALSSSLAGADQPRVGITGAVNPAAVGTPPGGESRPMVVGADVIFKERIVTTGEGQAQLLFLDQSSLLIGPNSQVIIDEFVFDPRTNKGNMVATLTQGSFRYIGGKLSKQGNATLRTPVATMGIRGSDAVVTYNAPTLHMEAFNLNGNATVQSGGGSATLPTGFGTSVTGNDQTPASPSAITAALIGLLNKAFEGQSGKTAGATQVPTNEQVSNSGLSQTVETKQLENIAPGSGGNGGAGGDITTPTVTDDPSQTARNATLPAGPPAAPPEPPGPVTEMNGYLGGLSTNGASTYAITSESPADVDIRTQTTPTGNGQVFARLVFKGANPQNLSGASIELGDPSDSPAPTQSQFVTPNNFGAKQFAGASEGKATIAGTSASAIGVLVTTDFFNASFPTPPAPLVSSLCECEFVTWGLWLAQLETAGPQSRLETVGLGTFVAGKLPNITDPTPQGSAVFSGMAYGFVQDATGSRQATGQFTNSYNFGQKAGIVSITGFDTNRTVQGAVNAGDGANWRHYSGTLAGSGLTGAARGSWFGNRDASGQLFPQNQPKETAGNFTLNGAGYQASGVFAAKAKPGPLN